MYIRLYSTLPNTLQCILYSENNIQNLDVTHRPCFIWPPIISVPHSHFCLLSHQTPALPDLLFLKHQAHIPGSLQMLFLLFETLLSLLITDLVHYYFLDFSSNITSSVKTIPCTTVCFNFLFIFVLYLSQGEIIYMLYYV